MNAALFRWSVLEAEANGRTFVGMPAVRDPDYVCESFDALGYQGRGECTSDGHYLCINCSHLSPTAPRFEEFGREGRADRLRLFWRRHR